MRKSLSRNKFATVFILGAFGSGGGGGRLSDGRDGWCVSI